MSARESVVGVGHEKDADIRPGCVAFPVTCNSGRWRPSTSALGVQVPVTKLKKISLFVLGGFAYFVLGTLAATLLWGFSHHRYEHPISGHYFGSIRVWFTAQEDGPWFSFGLEAETKPRWYWIRPRSFPYPSALVKWSPSSLEDESAQLDLVSMKYTKGGVTAPLTPDVLEVWLMNPRDAEEAARGKRWAEEIHLWLVQISRGEAPPPRHHTYRFERPFHIRVSHFCSGWGFPGMIYISWIVWLLFMVFRFWRMFGGTKPQDLSVSSHLAYDLPPNPAILLLG